MKTLFTALVLCVATIFSAGAQDIQKTDRQSREAQSVKQQPEQSPDAQAKALTDRMTRELNLSADQSKKVMEQNKKYFSNMATEAKKNMKEADMQSMHKKSMDDYDAHLKKILNEDQYKRYTSMKSDYTRMMQASHTRNMPEMDEMEK